MISYTFVTSLCTAFLLSILSLHDFSRAAATQEIDLFSTERNHSAPKRSIKKTSKPKLPKKSDKPAFVGKKFVLRGTALIGKKKIAVLQQVGKQEMFTLTVRPGASTPFPSDPRYQLEQIYPRKVRIRYPLASPCHQDDPAHNIHCVDDGKYAELTILRTVGPATKTAKPVAATGKPLKQEPKTNIIGHFPDTQAKKEGKENPFLTFKPLSKEEKAEQIKKMSKDPRYQKRKKQYKNFKPRRIKEEDVPPGMKLQRTPFGDVLIPD